MAKSGWLAKAALFLVLEIGALSGVPMRPEEIEALARSINGSVTTVETQSDSDPDEDSG